MKLALIMNCLRIIYHMCWIKILSLFPTHGYPDLRKKNQWEGKYKIKGEILKTGTGDPLIEYITIKQAYKFVEGNFKSENIKEKGQLHNYVFEGKFISKEYISVTVRDKNNDFTEHCVGMLKILPSHKIMKGHIIRTNHEENRGMEVLEYEMVYKPNKEVKG